jgi:hypothetical protein
MVTEAEARPNGLPLYGKISILTSRACHRVFGNPRSLPVFNQLFSNSFSLCDPAA